METAIITVIVFLMGASVFSFLNVVIYRVPKHLDFVKGRIAFRYVLVGVLGGLTAVGCTMKYGYTLQAVIVLAFFAILTVIAIVDQDTMEIPNGFVITVLVIGIISFFAFPEIGLLQRGVGAVAVSGPLLLITVLVPGAFGGGDIKLMAASGILLGWKLNLIALILAILTGGIYGIYLLAARKKGRKEHFAFGPFLCVGMALSLLWGEHMLNWYLHINS